MRFSGLGAPSPCAEEPGTIYYDMGDWYGCCEPGMKPMSTGPESYRCVPNTGLSGGTVIAVGLVALAIAGATYYYALRD